MRRPLLIGAILLLLALNTASGVSKIMAFVHRFQGERQLGVAELNDAFDSLRDAAAWQPGDSPTYVLIGRVIIIAQANGLPLEGLEGHGIAGTFSVGLGALARGISLNPADSWSWGNLASLYEGLRSARLRLETMRRAGEHAARGGDTTAGPEQGAGQEAEKEIGLVPEDVLAAAATMMARRLDPGFSYYSDALAKIYWDRGLVADAGREIEDSFSLTPQLSAHPVLDLKGLAQTLGDSVLAGIERSSSNHSLPADTTLRARAEMLTRLSRNEEAIAAYRLLRDAGGPGVEAECDLAIGRLQQEQGRYRESVTSLEAVAASGSGLRPVALYYLGLAYDRLGEGVKAESTLQEYLRLRPDALAGYWALAATLESLGKSDEAAAMYIAAVRRFPDNPAAYEKVIDQLSRHGRTREALAYAEGLMKIDPDRKHAGELLRRLRAETTGP